MNRNRKRNNDSTVTQHILIYAYIQQNISTLLTYSTILYYTLFNLYYKSYYWFETLHATSFSYVYVDSDVCIFVIPWCASIVINSKKQSHDLNPNEKFFQLSKITLLLMPDLEKHSIIITNWGIIIKRKMYSTVGKTTTFSLKR